MSKMIDTWCYGHKHSFKSMKAAQNFYFEGMQTCDGAERDRYTDIYCKLLEGAEPYCDCDGIPAPKKSEPKLTEADLIKAKELIKAKDEASDKFDALREELEKREREFERQNAELIAAIDVARDKWSDLSMDLIRLQKRGLSIATIQALSAEIRNGQK